MKRFWYIASYDKRTGEEVETFPVADNLAESLLHLMGYKKYQDCYDITSDGFSFLSKKRYNLAPTKLDYQLEVCSD